MGGPTTSDLQRSVTGMFPLRTAGISGYEDRVHPRRPLEVPSMRFHTISYVGLLSREEPPAYLKDNSEDVLLVMRHATGAYLSRGGHPRG